MLKKYLPIKIKAIYNRFHEIGPIPFSGGNLWVKKNEILKNISLSVYLSFSDHGREN